MTQTAIFLAVAALLLGLLVGMTLGRISARRTGSRERLSDQLRTRDQRLQLYERQVAEHFERTAQLSAELDRALDQLREQLAAGADKLVGEDLGNRIARRGDGRGPAPEIQPPRDYAPTRKASAAARPAAESTPADRSQLQLVEDDDPTYRVG